MRGLSVAVASLVVLSACGTAGTGWVYDKPGVAAGERERDETACLQASLGTPETRTRVFGSAFDRESYNRCMAERGYAVRIDEPRAAR